VRSRDAAGARDHVLDRDQVPHEGELAARDAVLDRLERRP
jgi:hypothetical protein